MKSLSRRDFLKVGGLTFLGTAGATALTQNNRTHKAKIPHEVYSLHVVQQGNHDDLPDTVSKMDRNDENRET